MVTRAQVIEEARSWLGTRWKHQARIKGVGVDCCNLVIAVGEKYGLGGEGFNWDEHTRYHGYGTSPNGTLLIEACEQFMDPIPLAEMRAGDIGIFRFVQEPQHFAIISRDDPQYMIHAYFQMRKVVEHRIDENWRDRIVAAYRYRGLED